PFTSAAALSTPASRSRADEWHTRTVWITQRSKRSACADSPGAAAVPGGPAAAVPVAAVGDAGVGVGGPGYEVGGPGGDRVVAAGAAVGLGGLGGGDVADEPVAFGALEAAAAEGPGRRVGAGWVAARHAQFPPK